MSDFFKHETAIVDEGARIGESTKIWHFTHVSKSAIIGKQCSLGQNVYVADQVQIGNGVKIQNNVSIYQGVTLEDDVFCGPSMVFTNVKRPRSFISQKDTFSQTLVKRGATIGANVTVICGGCIGAYAFIGAGALITRDIPDYALMLGQPAVQIGWVSRAGYRLDLPLTTEETCGAICPKTGERYQLIGTKLRKII